MLISRIALAAAWSSTLWSLAGLILVIVGSRTGWDFDGWIALSYAMLVATPAVLLSGVAAVLLWLRRLQAPKGRAWWHLVGRLFLLNVGLLVCAVSTAWVLDGS